MCIQQFFFQRNRIILYTYIFSADPSAYPEPIPDALADPRRRNRRSGAKRIRSVRRVKAMRRRGYKKSRRSGSSRRSSKRSCGKRCKKTCKKPCKKRRRNNWRNNRGNGCNNVGAIPLIIPIRMI